MTNFFSTKINDVSEKALQRAMFLKETSKLGGKADEIEWLDMELEVTPRGDKKPLRLDLIGRFKKERNLVICEVKFGNSFSPSDNPFYAADEVVKYYELAKSNCKDLNKSHHCSSKDGFVGKDFDWKDVKDKKTKLIVVANAAYWAYWIGHRKMQVPSSGEYNGETAVVECYSIDVPKNLFELQKNNRDGYFPQIDTNQLEVL